MNLYFQRSNGGYLLIEQDVACIGEALEQIKAFCLRHSYNSPYTRYWYEDENVAVFDVGSYTEFFKLADNLPIVGTEEDFIDRKQEKD